MAQKSVYNVMDTLQMEEAKAERKMRMWTEIGKETGIAIEKSVRTFILLYNTFSYAPVGEVVATQSLKTIQSYPRKYESTTVPNTHWSAFTPAKNSVDMPSSCRYRSSALCGPHSPLILHTARNV